MTDLILPVLSDNRSITFLLLMLDDLPLIREQLTCIIVGVEGMSAFVIDARVDCGVSK